MAGLWSRDETSFRAGFDGDEVHVNRADRRGLSSAASFFSGRCVDSGFPGAFSLVLSILEVFAIDLHALSISRGELLLADHRGKGGVLGVSNTTEAKCDGKSGSRNNSFDVHFNSLL